MKILNWATGLTFAALVAACGPMSENGPMQTITQEVRTALTASPQPTEQPAAIGDQAAAAPETTAAQPGSMAGDGLLVSLPTRGVGARLASVGRNGEKVTWMSPDGIGVITRNDILIGTRGLGHDLMGADVTDFSVITSGESNERLIERLDGTDQIQSLVFACVLTEEAPEDIEIATQKVSTTRYVETCQNGDFIFTNKYWVNGDARIVRSLQLVSPVVGYMVLQPI